MTMTTTMRTLSTGNRVKVSQQNHDVIWFIDNYLSDIPVSDINADLIIEKSIQVFKQFPNQKCTNLNIVNAVWSCFDIENTKHHDFIKFGWPAIKTFGITEQKLNFFHAQAAINELKSTPYYL